MALIKINRNPSQSELRWLGLVVLLFFGFIGGLIAWRAESMSAATVLWSIGGAFCFIYYALPPLRRPMYIGWMSAIYPIGWVISHVVMAITYYAILTPIGILRRVLGRDPMSRRLDPDASTYWIEKASADEPARYFRQF